MAKRPPSTRKTEADLVRADDTVEPAEPVVDPVTMAEPQQTAPEHAKPDWHVEPDLAASEPVTAEMPRAAEPEPVPPPPPSPPAGKTGRSGFLGTALGGVVAAAAGYALATLVPFPGLNPSDVPPLATQAEVQALTARLASLESALAPDAALSGRIAALEARPEPGLAAEPDLSPLTDALAALEARVASLESRGPVAPGEGPPADLVALVESLRAEIDDMRASGAEASAGIEALAAQTQARLAEAEAQAAALRAEAEATARKAVTAAALSRVQAAVESGVPFAAALGDMAGIDVPPALASLAETGVPTLGMLADAFPPAARTALEVSLRADMGEGWSDRLATFLQATTGARSLTPREGTDPDAVLSRAEASVRAGDLAQALTELQGLPPEGLAAMAEWSGMARQRLDAVAAVATLSAAVEG